VNFWKGKSVLVTGISGFVGPYLAEELIKKDAVVFGMVRPRAIAVFTKKIVDETLQNKLKLLEGDICNFSGTTKIIESVQPDIVFHLAAQSYVKESFNDPLLFSQVNCIGTANLLEAIKLKCPDATVVFAGSSEEYGIVFSSQSQYLKVKQKYENVYPEPECIPELPVREANPLRPFSPYGVSKVYGDYLMREYYYSFGLKTVISRAFNHEGAGRGYHFVTSIITKQAMQLKNKEINEILIGNVNSFRDWSHVTDIVRGYLLLAEKGKSAEVYIQGSMRTNSVLSYLLLAIEGVGYKINKIATVKNNKIVSSPTKEEKIKIFGVEFKTLKVDKQMLYDKLYFSLEDEGIMIYTDKGNINVMFDKDRFRSIDVPILLSDPSKLMSLGFNINYSLRDIVQDQLNYFSVPENRKISMDIS